MASREDILSSRFRAEKERNIAGRKIATEKAEHDATKCVLDNLNKLMGVLTPYNRFRAALPACNPDSKNRGIAWEYEYVYTESYIATAQLVLNTELNPSGRMAVQVSRDRGTCGSGGSKGLSVKIEENDTLLPVAPIPVKRTVGLRDDYDQNR